MYGREQMRALQENACISSSRESITIRRFTAAKCKEMDVTPDDIRTVDDVVKLPFTTKQDLRDNYPYGLFAVPMSQIVRLHASSGTTGSPTVVGYTRRDLAIWSEMIARCLSAFGTDCNDIFRWRTVTVCLPADWGCTMGWSTWGRPSFRCRAAIRRSTSS